MKRLQTIRRAAICGAAAALLAGAASAETIRWGAPRDIVSLDPYSYGDSYTINFLNHIYEGLVRYNRDLEIEPALATEWEIVSPTTGALPCARVSNSTTVPISPQKMFWPRWSG